MYRLAGPNLILFTIIVFVGVIVAAITPNYYGESRVLSLTALALGEIGLGFIPALVLFPKARPTQAIILAIIYFFTTFLICFGTWAINNIIQISNFAFMYKDNEFHINTHALFVTNFFSLLTLIGNFKLVYDEDLTKEFREKAKKYGGSSTLHKFFSFQKPLLKRPTFEEKKPSSPTSTKTTTKSENFEPETSFKSEFEEDFGKPFEFEPQSEVTLEELPQESSGSLFAPKEPPQKPDISELFGNLDTEEKPLKGFEEPSIALKTIETKEDIIDNDVKPLPPSDIKNELSEIFEQYSSLNAVKKITANKESADTKTIGKKEEEKKIRKLSNLPKEPSEMSIHIEGEDVHEASFRQISNEEKLEELKEELKKELQEKIEEKVNLDSQKIQETLQKTTDTKEEIIKTIENIKDELKKELQGKIEEKVNLDSQKIQETLQNTADTKEEIIKTIENIKDELKKELEEKLTLEKNEGDKKLQSSSEDILNTIKSIKEEIIVSLKEEIKKETLEKEAKKNEEPKPAKIYKEIPKITQDEIENLNATLITLNEEPKIIGSIFLTQNGDVITEKWKKKQVLHSDEDKIIIELFNSINKEVNKTNQGVLSNILLESENGTLVITKIDNKMLTICTKETSESDSCQVLKILSEIE